MKAWDIRVRKEKGLARGVLQNCPVFYIDGEIGLRRCEVAVCKYSDESGRHYGRGAQKEVLRSRRRREGGVR
jgi:hypothetical protein